MNVLICGAGDVGRFAAEEFTSAGRNNITIVDLDDRKLEQLDETLDVQLMRGNATQADVLLEAGCANTDLFIAATNIDEINLLSASIAKAVGARQCVARVHHQAYFEKRGLDYGVHLGIDHLVCPEQATAEAIVASLRSPGALAMQRFAHGSIEMQQIRVSQNSTLVDMPLRETKLPGSARIVAIQKRGTTSIPLADTVLEAGDLVTLIGDRDHFTKVCGVFDPEGERRQRVVLMGGSAQSVWLCRALRGKRYSVRLFEPDADRAEALAEKLDHVTVLRADGTDEQALHDEHIDAADAFVAATDSDEKNILAAAQAKRLGVRAAICVLQRSTYLHLVSAVGIDRAFSPRQTAVTEISWLLQSGDVRHVATIARGVVDVYEVRIPARAAKRLENPLRTMGLPRHFIVAAIQRNDEDGRPDVFVPGGDTRLQPGDVAVVIGPIDSKRELSNVFIGR